MIRIAVDIAIAAADTAARPMRTGGAAIAARPLAIPFSIPLIKPPTPFPADDILLPKLPSPPPGLPLPTPVPVFCFDVSPPRALLLLMQV